GADVHAHARLPLAGLSHAEQRVVAPTRGLALAAVLPLATVLALVAVLATGVLAAILAQLTLLGAVAGAVPRAVVLAAGVAAHLERVAGVLLAHAHLAASHAGGIALIPVVPAVRALGQAALAAAAPVGAAAQALA